MNILKIKYYISLILILLLTSCNYIENKSSAESNNNSYSDTLETEDYSSVIMTGDIMMGTNYPEYTSSNSLPPDDGKYLFEGVSDILSDADITVGNLEGTFLNSGGKPKVCNDPENCYSFRMPEHYAGYLREAGFDIMSIANNHSNDMGEPGRVSTINNLDKYNIKYAGYISCPETVIEQDGVKYGFTAFSPNTGTLSINDLELAKKVVSGLKNKCDVVIVSFHGGTEGSGAQRVSRKTEYFLGENRGNVYNFAHAVIDAGADIVFGHGPHVTRAMELYKGKIIAYSLGNFCTYGKFGLYGENGIAPILKVYIDEDGNFIKGKIFPVKQINRGFPVIDEDKKIIATIQKLSSRDFPDSDLRITDNGDIMKSGQ